MGRRVQMPGWVVVVVVVLVLVNATALKLGTRFFMRKEEQAQQALPFRSSGSGRLSLPKQNT